MLAQPIIEAEKKWAQLVVTNAKSILIRNKKVATGRLINSVRYTINSQGKIKFLYDKDGKWVTSGRKRNSRFPPPAAISKWIKQKGLPVDNIETASFLIARKLHEFGSSIYMYGNGANSGLLDNIVNQKSVQRLSGELVEDTVNEIKSYANAL
jgi:hypothetical protein